MHRKYFESEKYYFGMISSVTTWAIKTFKRIFVLFLFHEDRGNTISAPFGVTLCLPNVSLQRHTSKSLRWLDPF